MKRPNVLLLYTDQQRWDTIRSGGNELMQTPNLDRLATDGALFDMAFCNCPVCMPSRMSMLSGRYPAAMRIAANGIEMPPDVPCIHNVLDLYDYHTANIGKLHFKNHASQFRDHREPHPDYGFDTLVLSDEPGCYDDAYITWVERKDPASVPNCRCNTPPAWTGQTVRVHPRGTESPHVFGGPEQLTHTAFVADETCDYIRRHAHNPFFCIAGFYAPHAPINPPQRFVDLYSEPDMPLPHRNDGENFRDVSDDQWRKIKAHYYGLCSHIDDQVGHILNTLDEVGLAENTIVIHTADHGEHLGDHGLIAKGSFHDSCSRVPLVIRYPDAFGGGTSRSEIVEAADLAPTILDWCGVQIPPYMQGRSLRPLLEGRDYQPRSSAFIELRNPFGHAYKAVRTHDYTYCRYSDGRDILVDAASDPHQLQNVASDIHKQDLLHSAREEMLRRWFDVEGQYPTRSGSY